MDHARYILIRRLIEKRQAGEPAASDDVLDAWLAEGDRNQLIYEQLDDPAQLSALYNEYLSVRYVMQAQLEAAIPELAGEEPVRSTMHVGRVLLFRRAWFRYAAAAVLVLGMAAYVWNVSSKKDIQHTRRPAFVNNDVGPGGERAVLRLADGREINLDHAPNGEIAQQGSASIVKSVDGQILYRPAGAVIGDVMMNTMSTPRGGQYQLTLPDGSRVWLNAASSITYPTSFAGKDRVVSITGEAYFEVARKARQPFVVKTYKDAITVLGTRFNINAYSDEPAIKTSLLEGSVKVNDQIIRPGQAYANGKIIQTSIEQDVAWKNGLFQFKNADIAEVMRQAERWYDIEVIYRNTVSEHFTGKVPRNVNLSSLLEILEETGDVRFSIEGKKITVLK